MLLSVGLAPRFTKAASGTTAGRCIRGRAYWDWDAAMGSDTGQDTRVRSIPQTSVIVITGGTPFRVRSWQRTGW